MRILIAAMIMLTVGCSQNKFNVPKENFAKQVRVLGVVPIIVDSGSDIKHPMKDQIVSLLTDINRQVERPFVRRVKETGSFYTVAMLDVNPQSSFESLLFRRERRDDAAIQYNKYFWKESELAELVRRNNVDAVMFVIISGITRPDKVYGPNMIKSRTADYNFIIMTSQIVDAKGVVLWEYPNFRTKILSFDPVLNLQYPDFSEAEANLLTKPDIKFKSVEGIKRALEKRRKDILRRETPDQDLYTQQFDEIINLLTFSPEDARKEAEEEDPPMTAKESGKAPASKEADRAVANDPAPKAVSDPSNSPAPQQKP